MREVAAATEGNLESTDHTRLAYRAWPQADASVMFAVVHGMGEHSGRYETFARGMARFGMATYAVDLRGHGRSDGRRGHIDSWTQWVDDTAAFVMLVESHAQANDRQAEVIPLGHSFGGCVMLSAIRSGKLPKTKRFVLSSPALRLATAPAGWKSALGSVVDHVAPRLALDNGVDAATVSRIPEVVTAYRTDPLVHRKISGRLFAEWQRAAQDNLAHADEISIPFLILAGTADRLIDSKGSEELHARASATSDLRLLDGRYHEPFNDLGNDQVFEMIAEWVRK